MFKIEFPRRRGVRGVLIATALATATVALSGAASAATLTIAATSGPTSLDPTVSVNAVPGGWFPNLAYSGLIWRAPDGAAKPGLALNWA